MGRRGLVAATLLILGVALYLLASAEAPKSPSPTSSNRAPTQSPAAASSSAASPYREPACPEASTLVTRERTRFCVAIDAKNREIRTGPYARFHDSELRHLAEAGAYARGRKQGAWIEWYPGGAGRSRLEFRDGQAEGRWLEWYPDGTPKSEGYYASGEEDGLWSFWREDGTLAKRGSMRSGMRDGEWTGWHPSGAERHRRVYRDGVELAWEEWSPSGSSLGASDRSD